MDEIHHTLKLLHRSSQSAAKTFFDFLDQVTKDNDIRNHVHIRKVFNSWLKKGRAGHSRLSFYHSNSELITSYFLTQIIRIFCSFTWLTFLVKSGLILQNTNFPSFLLVGGVVLVESKHLKSYHQKKLPALLTYLICQKPLAFNLPYYLHQTTNWYFVVDTIIRILALNWETTIGNSTVLLTSSGDMPLEFLWKEVYLFSGAWTALLLGNG